MSSFPCDSCLFKKIYCPLPFISCPFKKLLEERSLKKIFLHRISSYLAFKRHVLSFSPSPVQIFSKWDNPGLVSQGEEEEGYWGFLEKVFFLFPKEYSVVKGLS